MNNAAELAAAAAAGVAVAAVAASDDAGKAAFDSRNSHFRPF